MSYEHFLYIGLKSNRRSEELSEKSLHFHNDVAAEKSDYPGEAKSSGQRNSIQSRLGKSAGSAAIIVSSRLRYGRTSEDLNLPNPSTNIVQNNPATLSIKDADIKYISVTEKILGRILFYNL